jgi:hypothetical protein
MIIWYTHLHITTVVEADYFHSNFCLTDIIWKFSDISSIVLHPGVFSSMALESSQLQNIAYQFVLNSITDLLWICFVVATLYWFVRHYEMCDCFWRILSMGSWYYYYFTPTSPILWPVYVFQFIVTVLLLLLHIHRTKVFLFNSLTFRAYSCPKVAWFTVVLYMFRLQLFCLFTLLQYQPTIFLLSYVSCLQLLLLPYILYITVIWLPLVTSPFCRLCVYLYSLTSSLSLTTLPLSLLNSQKKVWLLLLAFKTKIQFLPYGRSIGSWMSYTQDVYMSHVTEYVFSINGG